MQSVAAVDGVATVEGGPYINPQITVVPTSASGTGTVTGKPFATGAGYETVYDAGGNALSLDLSAQTTHTLIGSYMGFKITSDDSADTFTMSVAVTRTAVYG